MVYKVIHSAMEPVGKPQIEDCSPSRKSLFLVWKGKILLQKGNAVHRSKVFA